MRRFLHILIAALFTMALVSVNALYALASSGEDEHAMEMEVNGYHVKLASQNEWKKGENTIVVTLVDNMGMPVQDADVQLLIVSKPDEHSTGDSNHGAEEQHDSTSGMVMESETSHDSMPGMDMGENSAQESSMPAHDEQAAEPLAMSESDEVGIYTLETHIESSGEHEIKITFHANGEMLQATFVVNILQSFSKSLVLWSFVGVNVILISSAAILKKQSIPVKGS